MRTRVFAAVVCLGRVISLTIARSLEYPESGLNCYTVLL